MMKYFYNLFAHRVTPLTLVVMLVVGGIGMPLPVRAASYDFEVLVVGGGGGGGGSEASQDEEGAGGGGAGAFRTVTLSMPEGGHAIVIGSGGAGGTNGTSGADGGDSAIASLLVAPGGGAGGGTSDEAGHDGGSGGGGASSTSGGDAGGNGTVGQGNDAGDGAGTGSGGGGGGGAGAIGTNGDTTDGGSGGNGSSSLISGSSTTYAGGGGGGGGGTADAGGAGGSGGGGIGGTSQGGNGTAGASNSGGGGGGGAGLAGDGGAGGSGIVIIRYLTADIATAVGGTITTDGAYTVHTFTSGGTFSFTIGAVPDPPLTGMSDTLSVSVPASASNHTIIFTVTGGIPAGGSFSIDFQGAVVAFGMGSVDFGDIDVASSGGDLVLGACGAQAGGTWGVCVSGTQINFQSATGAVAVGSTLTIKIGTNATGAVNQLINPAATVGTKISFDTFDITDTSIGDGGTYVAIQPQVTLSATITDVFEFKVDLCAISGADQCDIDGHTVDAASTATLADFGTLTAGTPVTMGSSLSVTSNALNGFIVTVEQNHNMLASSGADIDSFADGTAATTGATWASPAETGGSENTYGHLGLHSEDGSLPVITNVASVSTGSDGDWFGLSGTSTATVWTNSSTGDGFTQDTGHIDVGYRVEISALQESGTYTNQLMYIATPTF